VRVIDVPAEPDGAQGIFERVPEGMTGGQFADALKLAAAQHHGHALRTWLQFLAGDIEARRTALRAKRDAIAATLTGPNAAGQVRRVAARFALIAAASELATTGPILTG